MREYEELKQAAAEMGINESEGQGMSAAASEPRRTRQPRSRARKPAARERRADAPAERAPESAGELSERVLAAVQSNPGQAVGDYARMLDVQPTAIYRPVRELTDAGKLVKRARQLYPG